MESRPNAALRQLAAVPGVVGGMVFDGAGAVVDAAFPAVFDPAGLRQLAGQLSSDGYFQDWLCADNASLCLRFGDGWVVLRALDGQWLLVLCTVQANPELLSMSITQAVRRLRSGRDALPAVTGEFQLPVVPPLPAPVPAPSLVDRLRAIATAELGAQAAQAHEILAGAGPGPKELLRATAEIEKMTRLFINKKKADEIGQKMRNLLAGSI